MNSSPDPGQAGVRARLAVVQAAARQAWQEADPFTKCQLVADLAGCLDQLGDDPPAGDGPPELNVEPVDLGALEPGRPSRPLMVLASQVPKRAPGSAEGLGALLHAIAHIEFNAINLALDAVWRYPYMPVGFARDWLSVAVDEARHFRLLTDQMAAVEVAYGDHDAHDGLWTMARRTADDLLARMALVPRVLEARGLDATPAIQQKLRSAGHRDAVDVLQIILDEEVRHVSLGNDWFQRLCQQAGVEPEEKFQQLLCAFDAPRPRGKMNRTARLKAGFTNRELDWLQGGGRG
ncbi:MAG: ferritin-like domain-containing protein [Burkholderiaceae bacterium]